MSGPGGSGTSNTPASSRTHPPADAVQTLEINSKKKRMVPIPNFRMLTSQQSPAFFDNTGSIRVLCNSEYQISMHCLPPGSGKSVLAQTITSFLRNPEYYSRPEQETEASDVYQDHYFLINTPTTDFNPQDWYKEWPVIRLNMRVVSGITLHGFLLSLRSALSETFAEHQYLASRKFGEKELADHEKKQFHLHLTEESDDDQIPEAIPLLAMLISKYTGKKPIVVVDDADHPMNSILMPGVVEARPIYHSYRNFINVSFDVNVPIEKAFLFGVLPSIATSSMKVYTVFDNPLAPYFNVSSEQVDSLVKLFGEVTLHPAVGDEMKRQLGGITSFQDSNKVEQIALRPLVCAVNQLGGNHSREEKLRRVKRLFEERVPSIPELLSDILYDPKFLAETLGFIRAFRMVPDPADQKENVADLPKVSIEELNNVLNLQSLAEYAVSLSQFGRDLRGRMPNRILRTVPDHRDLYRMLSVHYGYLVPVKIDAGEATVQIPNDFTCRMLERKVENVLREVNATACNEFSDALYDLHKLPTKADVELELEALKAELREIEHATATLPSKAERHKALKELAEKNKALEARQAAREKEVIEAGDKAAQRLIKAFGDLMLAANRSGMLSLPDITEATVSAALWAIAKHRHDFDGSGVEYRALKTHTNTTGRTDIVLKDEAHEEAKLLELLFYEGTVDPKTGLRNDVEHWIRLLRYASIALRKYENVKDVTRIMLTMKRDPRNPERLLWAECLIVRGGVNEKFDKDIYDPEMAHLNRQSHYVFKARWNRSEAEKSVGSSSVGGRDTRAGKKRRGEPGDQVTSPPRSPLLPYLNPYSGERTMEWVESLPTTSLEGDTHIDDPCSHCPARCARHRCDKPAKKNLKKCQRCPVPEHLRSSSSAEQNIAAESGEEPFPFGREPEELPECDATCEHCCERILINSEQPCRQSCYKCCRGHAEEGQFDEEIEEDSKCDNLCWICCTGLKVTYGTGQPVSPSFYDSRCRQACPQHCKSVMSAVSKRKKEKRASWQRIYKGTKNARSWEASRR